MFAEQANSFARKRQGNWPPKQPVRLQKHLLMQITGLPQEGTLRSELNSVLAGITATLRTIVKNDEDSE
jgi:hypothetical protein